MLGADHQIDEDCPTVQPDQEQLVEDLARESVEVDEESFAN